jgi:aspartyl-tRNA(Asn)/glutamyl-tRNA(Gln) amidotransferase subunit A
LGTLSRRQFLLASLATSVLLLGDRAFGAAEDLTRLSLQEASNSVRRRSVSPLELTQAYLSRIEKLNPSLNAYITVTAEQALSRARELETEQQHGRWRGPLHGIPIALKDLIDTAGIRTTAASAVFAERIPTEDAEVVRRLKEAGAVILGKLNMSEFANGVTSVDSHFGPVHNPWQLDRIAGGSSGGSGAAVAAGLCCGALGTDTGGSIRQPAAYCGIVGLNPTYGRVSTYGVIPLSWSMDCVGSMCRTVADTALLLQAIARYDPKDSASLDAEVPDYSAALRAKTSALRLGIPRTMFYQGLDPEIEASMNKALRVLRRLTRGLSEVELPTVSDLPSIIINAEAYAFHAPHFLKHPELYQPLTRQELQSGSRVTTPAYIQARRELDQICQTIGNIFSSVDLLVAPTTPILPITIEEAKNKPEDWRSIRNTSPFSIYGLPSISISCGFSRSGLPIGLQICGPYLDEPQILALAYAYEQETDWHTRRPASAKDVHPS